jgi:hypothetical protein
MKRSRDGSFKAEAECGSKVERDEPETESADPAAASHSNVAAPSVAGCTEAERSFRCSACGLRLSASRFSKSQIK